MRILIAECKQEVSTFNPAASHYADFVLLHGQALLDYHRGVRDEIAGALGVLDATGAEIVPACSARAITSGGTLAAADWQRLRAEWLAALRDAGELDGVYFCMHGAMCAEDEVDPEGALLKAARAILGEWVPIVISLDLHGILTDRMLRYSDCVVPYHTYPHTDFLSTGERSARALLRIVRGEVRPVTACVEIPALARGDELITASGAIRHAVDHAKRIEAQPGGIAAALMWGNPFTDVPDLRSNSLVTLDGDREGAAREALAIARLFWDQHEKMRVPLTTVQDAVRTAIDMRAATPAKQPARVVLVDAADATSSGASGDSNVIVRALLDAGFRGRALAPIVDAPAVQAAFAAGVGRNIRLTLGGTLDPLRFAPWPVTARVRMLSDGEHFSETTRSLWFAGPTAVLEVNGSTIIATSRPVSLYDRALFYAHGRDPLHYDCVIVKSPQCEPHMFRAWANQYIDVDAPGSTSANLLSLPFQQVTRPVWPLDAVTFLPRVKFFARG